MQTHKHAPKLTGDNQIMLPALVLNTINQSSSGPSPKQNPGRSLLSPDLPMSYSIGLGKLAPTTTTSYKQGLKIVTSSAKNKASSYI